MSFQLEPIAVIHTPFREKFGTPRQPGLVPTAEGWLEFLPPFSCEEALQGLEQFSHLWLIALFHATAGSAWQPMVRPPRLGGNVRQGVFATRSPFRPNPLALSCCRLLGIERRDGKLGLRLEGVDLIDGTPILDLKPYVPYADCHPEARGGAFQEKPDSVLQVGFTSVAEAQLREQQERLPQLRALIIEVLQLDPRPAYQAEDPQRTYGVSLHDLNIRWQLVSGEARVIDIQPPGSSGQD